MTKFKKRHKDKIKDTKKDIEKKEEVINVNRKEYEALKEKAKLADEQLEILMRRQAEFENARKRIERERQEFIKFANDEIISKLLPVLDNFRRALDNSHQGHSVNDVLSGIRLIDKQFEDVLKEFGLTSIEAKGKKFDPHYHEAALHEETDEFEEGTVMEEFQRGYLLNGRLLKPTVVKVAKKKEVNQEEKKEED